MMLALLLLLFDVAAAGDNAEQVCTKAMIPPGIDLPWTRVPDRTPENVTLPFPVYCQKGYVPKDVQLQTTCRRTQQGSLEWTNPCRPITCRLPVNPAGGAVRVNGRRVGSVANYTCKMGMEYVGTNPRVCQEDGHFSGTDGNCRPVTKGCDDPDLPENVIVTSNDGETLTLSCDSDELAYTGQDLVCIARVWSASMGTCVAKKDISCHLPHIGSAVAPPLSFMSYDQVYHPICLEGCHYVGGTELRCLANGSFSGTPGKCLPHQQSEMGERMYMYRKRDGMDSNSAHASENCWPPQTTEAPHSTTSERKEESSDLNNHVGWKGAPLILLIILFLYFILPALFGICVCTIKKYARSSQEDSNHDEELVELCVHKPNGTIKGEHTSKDRESKILPSEPSSHIASPDPSAVSESPSMAPSSSRIDASGAEDMESTKMPSVK